MQFLAIFFWPEKLRSILPLYKIKTVYQRQQILVYFHGEKLGKLCIQAALGLC